jgi:DNA modification methylase
MSVRIIIGDARETLATLPERSVQTCVTSPPYFGLRDYGHGAQIGLEATPDAYVAELVALFRAVRRVLRDDGTLWLNLGDSYAGRGVTGGMKSLQTDASADGARGWVPPAPGFKDKDLYGIPWRVAFALQADGWWLRSDIVWHKPSPMPESVTDRPTKAHEYVFLLTKAERYYYDADAIAEEAANNRWGDPAERTATNGAGNGVLGVSARFGSPGAGTRNARTVWTIATQPYRGAHFATMPPALAERCIRAGSRLGDTVLDPFGGAGTTGLVADRLGRDAILCELNPAYAALAEQRIRGDSPLFAEVVA